MKELNVEASVLNTYKVLAFVDEQLKAADCPMTTQTQIDMSVEEIFVNIAKYAYAPESGTAVIRFELKGEPPAACITFLDSGMKFDPLAKEDPNIYLPKNKRPIGGLGIFMVKEYMDSVLYEYKDGKNVLEIIKKLDGNTP